MQSTSIALLTSVLRCNEENLRCIFRWRPAYLYASPLSTEVRAPALRRRHHAGAPVLEAIAEIRLADRFGAISSTETT